MTATPIPRTLALTLYGDLQLSVLDEMPPGRKPVITKKISERNRPSLEKFLQQQTAAGRQIYVVCPLVEETEKSDLVSATQTAETIKTRFPESAVALLHGRMKSQEKETIMHDFRHGKIDILVATTVIEVGVNVPNASVMVVEGAERFGLAQLHQLRGRVGRGNEQSYCILISNGRDSTRLNILCSTEDGFKIAEEDLKIRGPGELLGLRQHGVPELKLTDLSRDGIFVERAHRILQRVLEHPEQHERLFKEVNRLYPNDQIGVN
jgi:ATP-dependent DNA helicase RecG